MKILQADDHALFRDGVRYILARLCAEPPEILESADFRGTLDQMSHHRDLDLVLLDLRMPGMQGMLGLTRLVERFPAASIVILSASESQADIEASLDAGAVGFVPKSSPSSVLLAALNLVLAGGVYAPRSTVRHLRPERVRNGLSAHPTTRQHEIVSCIAEGMSNKAIANQLFLAESTIKGHVRGLLQVLDARNRVQAINKARELGFLSW